MAERPILFSAPMIRALLAGRKTQTRRIVKPVPDWGTPGPCPSVTPEGWQGPIDYSLWAHEGDKADGTPRRCPYGKPGDSLWVRESCRAKELTTAEAYASEEEYPPGLDGVVYLADDKFRPIENSIEASDRWGKLNIYRGKRGATVPPIHMPRWAARLTLKITDIRVERLQSINQADCIAEGISSETNGFVHHVVADYRKLWTQINGADSWDTNPWVWALTFEVQQGQPSAEP